MLVPVSVTSHFSDFVPSNLMITMGLGQRDRPLFLNRLHREIRGHGFQLDPFDQPDVNGVIAFHVAGHDFEQVIIVATNAKKVDDLRDGCDMMAEIFKPIRRVVARAHHDENHQSYAQLLAIQNHGAIA